MEKVILKKVDDEITDELMQSVIGKLIYVPVNMHSRHNKVMNRMEEVNVWFAGTVAGYRKEVVVYDFTTEEFTTDALVYYSLLLTDGYTYTLSARQSEIEEISEEVFAEMVEREQKIQEARESILIP